jgi:hypothetical protein
MLPHLDEVLSQTASLTLCETACATSFRFSWRSSPFDVMRARIMPPTLEANATIACFLRNAFVLPGAIPLRKPMTCRPPVTSLCFAQLSKVADFLPYPGKQQGLFALFSDFFAKLWAKVSEAVVMPPPIKPNKRPTSFTPRATLPLAPRPPLALRAAPPRSEPQRPASMSWFRGPAGPTLSRRRVRPP